MPTQQQLRWSELRVGITVIVASVVLAILIFLMSGSTGLFTKKLTLKSYFQNTGGLRMGAPVSLQGVTIGNVKAIRIVADRQLDPVEVTFKVGTEYQFRIKKDSIARLTTAGVLGELYVDIETKAATGAPVKDGDVLASEGATQLEDTIRASQSTIENADVLVKRLDRLVAGIERGEGSLGKVFKDPSLFNRTNDILSQMQQIVDDLNQGKGSAGKFLKDDEVYLRINAVIGKLDRIIDDVNQGKGNAGLFLKDDKLYKNANETIAKANRMMDDINAGRGALGKMTKDEEFARKLDVLVTKLSAISDRLEAGEGSAGKMLRDPSIYNNADQMLVETRNLIKSVRENPRKYLTIHLKIF